MPDPTDHPDTGDPPGACPRARGLVRTLLAVVAPALSSLLAACVVVAWLALAADWWPGAANIDDEIRFFGLVFGGYALVAAGVLWLVPAVCALRWLRLRSRLLLVPPAVVLLGGAAVFAVSVLTSYSFSDSRPDFDALAADAATHPPGWSERYERDSPRRVGHEQVSRVAVNREGVVMIDDADGSAFFTTEGWAWSPAGPPDLTAYEEHVEVHPVEGPWYRYELTW